MRVKFLAFNVNRHLLSSALAAFVVWAGLAAGGALAADTAVVATVAPDYSSGAYSLISVDPVGGPRTVRNNLLPTATSDITVAAFGRHFYRIERYMADAVSKFDMAAPETPIWQYSTLGSDQSSNPYGLVFVSEQKAYLLRYGTTRAWIVNPAAATEAEFLIGELNLDSYADSDGIPEMCGAALAGGKLFIIMQRLDRDNGWANSNTAYAAVFDVATDTEIETGLGDADGVKGLPLPVKNPVSIQYLTEDQSLYIAGAGQFPSSSSGPTGYEYTGGLVRLDPETYQAVLILDDGDADNHPFGAISGLTVVSPTRGYFVGYAGWGDNCLYPFDPSTGSVGPALAGLEHKNIAGMESGTYVDKNGRLWVCDQTEAEVVIVNTADNTVEERVGTNLNPTKVVFCSDN
ncbi:MAG: hypothetical protein JRJ59_04435 [Deltaproteobacteria bacterium]|nr:hypothetical protein [Deltaproteobacteria bacterium]